MTPDEMRIAIAEKRGWSIRSDNPRDWLCIRPDGVTVGYLQKSAYPTVKDAWLDCFEYDTVPDYLSDLNAMHEAEMVLTPEQTNVYRDHLLWLHRPTDYQHGVRVSGALSATAAQRAEAFCRTLWPERFDCTVFKNPSGH